MRAQVTFIVDSQTTRGVSRNLSQTGVQVEGGGLKEKDEVRLSFRLPLTRVAVDAIGSVVWEHDNRHGIRFTNVGQQSRKSILEYTASFS